MRYASAIGRRTTRAWICRVITISTKTASSNGSRPATFAPCVATKCLQMILSTRRHERNAMPPNKQKKKARLLQTPLALAQLHLNLPLPLKQPLQLRTQLLNKDPHPLHHQTTPEMSVLCNLPKTCFSMLSLASLLKANQSPWTWMTLFMRMPRMTTKRKAAWTTKECPLSFQIALAPQETLPTTPHPKQTDRMDQPKLPKRQSQMSSSMWTSNPTSFESSASSPVSDLLAPQIRPSLLAPNLCTVRICKYRVHCTNIPFASH